MDVFHDKIDVFGKTRSCFKSEAIVEVLKMQWKDDKIRINDEATELMLELTRRLTTEIAMRAANQANLLVPDGMAAQVELQHVEKIMPQILLDF